MFRILQHARKDSMTTLKTRKYIAYALGEIALIVIGILIGCHESVRKQSEELVGVIGGRFEV